MYKPRFQEVQNRMDQGIQGLPENPFLARLKQGIANPIQGQVEIPGGGLPGGTYAPPQSSGTIGSILSPVSQMGSQVVGSMALPIAAKLGSMGAAGLGALPGLIGSGASALGGAIGAGAGALGAGGSAAMSAIAGLL